ncbi:hypothetical protein ACPPVQ_16330 [Diaminobutyricibacter sp. McL0618]|uniref:hypothetical protein n=1 Tax=Leifsonia sp. McL0618 TaxID=3415677 RepID=UPI003CF77715
MVTAYIDESGGSGRELQNVYILAATIPLTDQLSECRSLLLELKPAHARKLHWYEAGESDRTRIVETIARIEAMHVIVESVEPPETKDERHRRLCMRLLLARLDHMGVDAVVFESRGLGSNHRDRTMVKTMRVDGTISADMEVTHRDGPFEPLLWIPDAVCGAVVDRRLGRSHYLALLHGTIDWITRGP